MIFHLLIFFLAGLEDSFSNCSWSALFVIGRPQLGQTRAVFEISFLDGINNGMI
jgi:hypothetical protein